MQEALKTSNPATINNFFWYYNAQEQHILQVKKANEEQALLTD
jgi:hypothetical protein